MGRDWKSLPHKGTGRETRASDKGEPREEKEKGEQMTIAFISWLLGFLTGLMFLVVWIDTGNIKKEVEIEKLKELTKEIKEKNERIEALKREIKRLTE